jgi:ATP-dependent RNA helicase DbpA
MIDAPSREQDPEFLPVHAAAEITAPAVPSATAFESLGLTEPLLTVLRELGFTSLTPIQAQSIPALLEGRDLVGQSRTGSGKTAAYALPLLSQLQIQRREVTGLVVCPTRELSAQVARELRRFGRNLAGLSVALIVGGQPHREQAKALEHGAHLVVGTPGRLNDLVARGTLKLDAVNCVVLDEADRMLDMGFEQEVTTLLGQVPKAHQTVFFSATFPAAISALSAKHQRSPLRVSVREAEDTGATTEELAVQLLPQQKLTALLWLLGRYTPEAALVFASQKYLVTETEQALVAAGVSAESLHGDLEQFDRDRVMAKFRNGSTRVLVATDIAARGIDLDKLDLVVNMDLPEQPEVYVHRIGRTGRAGNVGRAVSLCAPGEQSKLDAIARYVGRVIPTLDYRSQADHGRTPAIADREARMDTLRISGGRKDKLRPSDILGALTGEAGGLDGDQVGKIEIHDHFTYVAVAKAVSTKARQSLTSGRIKGKRFRVDLSS